MNREIMAAGGGIAVVCSECGQRQGGRRSWWMLGFLLAGVMCTVGCMLGNNIQQLKADNRGLRKELAIKEQVVSNLAYTLKTVNRHQHNQFQALEQQWRSGQSGIHRSTPVNVWTFDGARW